MNAGRGLRWGLDPALHHLNHGSFGAVPDAVQAEQDRWRRLTEQNPVRWFAALPQRVAQARNEIAALLDVDATHLAFVPNVSAGVSAVFNSLAGQEPVNVMVTDHAYGAVTMGAERLAARTGGRCQVISIPLDASSEQVLQIIEPELRRHQNLIVIDQITSATARSFPVAEICALARQAGVRTLVDGAHAPGMIADPVCREADYWVGNLHKFWCAPRGTAILVARDGSDLFPVIDSWGIPEPFPVRFDYQGTLDVSPWLTAAFAWHHIEDALGWRLLWTEASHLLDEGCQLVAEALGSSVADPLPDVGQPIALMRLVRLPAPLARDRVSADGLRIPFMEEAKTAVSFTSFLGQGYLRLSAHAYTEPEDFSHLAEIGVPVLQRWAREHTRL